MRHWFALLILVFACGGCIGRGVFHCRENDQCGADGTCEATGVCSLRDSHCASGRRYRSQAPDALADRCVEDACLANPVTRVRAGGGHACLLKSDGTVSCWGQDADGQTADPKRVASANIEPVSGLPLAATDLSLGGRHSCAILSDHSVWCWGANESGQLGDGTVDARATPMPVPQLDDVVAMASGAAFSCALRADTSVLCWGKNSTGELAQGLVGTPSLSPLAVPDLTGVTRLTAADRHACVLTKTGEVYCWGSNFQGELGDGTLVARARPTRVALASDPLTSDVPLISDLSAGVAHTCLLSGGVVRCWGANQLGEVGDGGDSLRLAPTQVQLLSSVTGLAAAGHHTCAVQSEGTVWCWGANQAGQLGEGTTTNIGVPVPVSGVSDAAAVTVGDTFSCARRLDGTLSCWGDDRAGQLGLGTRVDRAVPTNVVGVSSAESLALGANHTCARVAGTTGMSTMCWGANQAGQLGDGTRMDRGTAAPLKIALDARQISAGAFHTCLLSVGDRPWCWGRGNAGQLGSSMMIDYVVPLSATALPAAVQIAAGAAHTCAMTGAGVACWGANDEGQLGDGSEEKRTGFVSTIGLGPEVVQVVSGAVHSCARRGNGTVACWGRGVEGQLGDGNMTSSFSPVDVLGIADAVSIAAGDRHTCAVAATGHVSCWGAGADGQLGWGSNAPTRAIPSLVMGIRDAVEVVAGAAHTCARTNTQRDPLAASEMFCWGANAVGQLGDDTRVPQLKSSGKSVVADAVSIGAGGAHTCAIHADHTISCWGDDAFGQLGAGRVLQFATAQPARIPCP